MNDEQQARFLSWVISQAIMIEQERGAEARPCLPQNGRPLRFPVPTGECPHHPQPEYRECHHVGREYVAVYWGASPFGAEGWLARKGNLDDRGAMTSWADSELAWMLEVLHRA